MAPLLEQGKTYVLTADSDSDAWTKFVVTDPDYDAERVEVQIIDVSPSWAAMAYRWGRIVGEYCHPNVGEEKRVPSHWTLQPHQIKIFDPTMGVFD